jgi:hypothetical protein
MPTVRGMTTHTDWSDLGGGIFRRTMEESPTPHGIMGTHERDNYDPMILVESDASLAYDGDNISSPRDGHWSYNPTTHEITVNPLGADASAVMVPLQGNVVTLASSSEEMTQNVTLRALRIEGSRGAIVDGDSTPPNYMSGLVFSGLQLRHAARYFILLSRGAPNVIIENTLGEYGMRGYSWAAASNDGFFGFRLFQAHGGIVRGNTIRHIGSSGQWRFSGTPPGSSVPTGSDNYWRCYHCDTPWNDPTWTRNSSSGEAMQAKQTDGFLFDSNFVDDASTMAYTFDCTRRGRMHNNTARHVMQGLNTRNQTPSGSWHYSCDNTIDGNTVEDSGGPNMRVSPGCGFAEAEVEASQLEAGCTYIANVTNNTFTHPTCDAIAAPTSPLITISGNTTN